MRSSGLPIDRRWFMNIAWGTILGAFVRVMTGWTVSEGGASRRALFFVVGAFWVQMLFLLRLLLLWLRWHVLNMRLHSARGHWSNFGHLRNNILSLSFRCLISFRVQNWFYNLLRPSILVRKSLPVLLVLLSLMVIIYYLGSHVWYMGGCLSIRLFVDRSDGGATLDLSVGVSSVWLSHISLSI